MIHVLTALPDEAAALGGRALAVGAACRLTPGLCLHVTGVGPIRAARAARALLAAPDRGSARALVSLGVAGALKPGLRAGEVLVPEAIILGGSRPAPTTVADVIPAAARGAAATSPAAAIHTGTMRGEKATLGPVAPDRWPCDPTLIRTLEAGLGRAGLTVHRGVLLASAHPLLSPAEKRGRAASGVASKKQETVGAAGAGGSLAVDMESAAIAAAAAEASVPFACVRVIVDEIDMRVPAAAVECLGEDGRVDLPRLLQRLLHRPADWLPMGRLALAFGRARRSLRRCRPLLEELAR